MQLRLTLQISVAVNFCRSFTKKFANGKMRILAWGKYSLITNCKYSFYNYLVPCCKGKESVIGNPYPGRSKLWEDYLPQTSF
ncbi:hypothetical protein XENTR_v10016389 [Xenopus tropicalis]|nr:hypothetical protein XENTR_v10016389 [Xenopus tropicalis]